LNHSIGVVVGPYLSSGDMGPKVGLFGPIVNMLVRQAPHFSQLTTNSYKLMGNL